MTSADFQPKNTKNTQQPAPGKFSKPKKKKSRFVRICLLVTVLCAVMTVLFMMDRQYTADLTAYAEQVEQLTEEASEEALSQLEALTEPEEPWYHSLCDSVGALGRGLSQTIPGLDAFMDVQYGEYRAENYEQFFAR